ncbi:unnamed protein product [Dracunculus medinensis]|uniref:Ima1_N domain-containing protein n=1 Tax=Dracunculus medinensis TaxID=318479 RepID=A0A0N4UGJ8_DRAME|nr:unnamed protein product [Dracunculus medinensis]
MEVYLTYGIIFFISFVLLFCAHFFKVEVNCWFCNRNFPVEYSIRKSFVCPFCDQYNGFTNSGDYDKIIREQRYEYLNPPSSRKAEHLNRLKQKLEPTDNGICNRCNATQNLIQTEINSFEPKNENNYANELNEFKSRLHRAYPLCRECEVYLMVLIFLDYSEESKDVLLSRLGFSSILTVLSFAVTFLPRKLLHRKRQNSILKSAFSIASTPQSQCSTISTSSAYETASNNKKGMSTCSIYNDNSKSIRDSTPRELGFLLSGLRLERSDMDENSVLNRKSRGFFTNNYFSIFIKSLFKINFN